MSENENQDVQKLANLLWERMQEKMKTQSHQSEQEKEEGIHKGESHWRTEDINLSCPECSQNMANLLKKMRESSTSICRDCGYPLGDENHAKQLKGCPSCGSTRAKHK